MVGENRQTAEQLQLSRATDLKRSVPCLVHHYKIKVTGPSNYKIWTPSPTTRIGRHQPSRATSFRAPLTQGIKAQRWNQVGDGVREVWKIEELKSASVCVQVELAWAALRDAPLLLLRPTPNGQRPTPTSRGLRFAPRKTKAAGAWRCEL